MKKIRLINTFSYFVSYIIASFDFLFFFFFFFFVALAIWKAIQPHEAVSFLLSFSLFFFFFPLLLAEMQWLTRRKTPSYLPSPSSSSNFMVVFRTA